jgi:hypothetical protein
MKTKRDLFTISYIIRKVKEKGLVGSARRATRLFTQLFSYKVPWPLNPIFYCHLLKLIFTPCSKRKRILGIWDFKALPRSFGDPMVFLETLSVIKLKNDAEEVDVCIVCDRENPGGNRPSNLNAENVQDYMLDILPLFRTCPYLGTIYEFNSRKEFYGFLKPNMRRYHVFPPLSQHLSEAYNCWNGADFSAIEEFYQANGYIPYLRIGERENFWAYSFYLKHLPPKTLPVALSLRQTSYSIERNANNDVWLSFIDKCRQSFPEVTFVLVGLKEEVFDDIRERPNVIISKDFGTSLIEDLALIRASLLYMAPVSGVGTIAQFSDLPYLMFQIPTFSMRQMGLKPGEQFCFLTDKQKMFDDTTAITAELLFKEFREIYNRLEQSKWRSIASEKARAKKEHPSYQ